MRLRDTLWVRLWALVKVPALWYMRPSVVELTSERAVVRIPYRRRTRNHVGSVYVGALCIGAECAGGLAAMKNIQETGNRVSLIFKDLRADFLRRAEGPVHFECTAGPAIGELVREALESGERVSMPVNVVATVPDIDPEPVARFVLTLSLKRRQERF